MNYKIARIIRRIVLFSIFLFCFWYLWFKGIRRDGSACQKCRQMSSQMAYKFLSGLKMVVSLPGRYRAMIRLFSDDIDPIDKIWERREYEAFGGPQPGDVVIDAGAHIGFFTMRASRIVGPNGLVIAIEPHPDSFELLWTNIKFNSLNNVLPIRAALGDEEGFAQLSLGEKGRTLAHSMEMVRSRRHLRVPLITLDQLIEKLGIIHLNFMKIDVEGAEHKVLRGGKKVLSYENVRVAMEVHPYENIKTNVINSLRALKYKVAERDELVYAWK